MDRGDSYFRSNVDFGGYLIVYMLIPIAQVVIYLEHVAFDVFPYMSVLMFGFAYECYTRHRHDMQHTVKRSHSWITTIVVVMLVYSVGLCYINYGGVKISLKFMWAFLLLTIPWGIAIWNGANNIRVARKVKEL